jgi:hypothetical protein
MAIFSHHQFLTYTLIMKKIFTTCAVAALTVVSSTSFAQPSDSQVKSRAIQAGAKKVEFYGTGNVHNTISEIYYIRSFVASYATQYPGVTQLVSTEYKYTKSGGSWNFNKEFIVESLYDGIDNPSQDEIMTMINGDMKEFLGGSYTDVVGDIESIKIADEPHWMWSKVSQMSVDMEAVYSKKMSSTKVSKVKQIHTVTLYSDGFKKPWNKMLASKKGYPDVLSTQEYSAEEVRNMKTMSDLVLDREAEALMASLPAITIPDFNNTKEAIVHTYKMLREYSYDEFKAYMYQMLDAKYFHDNSKVLNDSGERLFEDMKDVFAARSSFKDQYCEHPKLKSDGETTMELWNRAKDRHTRISLHNKEGKYVITALSAYVFMKDEDINRVKASGDSNCGEAIKTDVAEVITFEVGESCKVSVRGYGWLNGTVKQKDSNFDNRYLVHDQKRNKTEWYTVESMDKVKTTSTTNSSNTTTTNTSTGTTSSETTKTTSTDSNTDKKVDEEKKDEKKKVDTKDAKNKVKGLKGKIKIGG